MHTATDHRQLAQAFRRFSRDFAAVQDFEQAAECRDRARAHLWAAKILESINTKEQA